MYQVKFVVKRHDEDNTDGPSDEGKGLLMKLQSVVINSPPSMREVTR